MRKFLGAARPWLGRIHYGWLLAPLVASVVVLVAFATGFDKATLYIIDETFALVLLGVSLAICLYRWGSGHGRTFAPLAFLVASLFVREIHFAGTDVAIYVCLVIFVVWTWREWGRLSVELEEGSLFGRLFASLFTYVFSQLVARRVFRGMPGEEELHIHIEETMETAGHVLMLAASLGSLALAARGEGSGDAAQEREDAGGD